MPFKSQAQRRKFAELLVKGENLAGNVRGVEPRDRFGEASGAGEEGKGLSEETAGSEETGNE